MKPYRLLRNNKESGPYSATELIQMGLKPYDLVWVDGKSASWRYPSEIAEFKPYAPAVEEQPFDRFYKKPVPAENVPAVQTATRAEVPADLHTIPSVAVRPPKPRIRIKADSTRIDTTVYQAKTPVTYGQEMAKPFEEPPLQKPAPQVIVPENIPLRQPEDPGTPDWKEMWLDWEQEKKAVQDARKVNVAAALQSASRTRNSGSLNERYTSMNGKGELLETKFSQSLDDIKEQYIETVLNKSKKTSTSAKNNSLVTVVVLVGAILAIGIWLGVKWSGKSSSPAEQKIVQNLPQTPAKETAEDQAALTQPEAGNQEGDLSRVSETSVDQPLTTVSKTVVAKKSSNRIYTKPKNISRSTSAVAKQDRLPDNVAMRNNSGTGSEEKKVSTETIQQVPVQDAQKTAISKFKKSEPKISDYISVSGNTTSHNAVGVSLVVQNVSDIPVDLVMIDLQYYDGNGRFEKGETVYVRSVAAGQSVTVRVPDNTQASRVGYKVSMVSSEDNNLYLIAD